jgi:hypothetical protein
MSRTGSDSCHDARAFSLVRASRQVVRDPLLFSGLNMYINNYYSITS